MEAEKVVKIKKPGSLKTLGYSPKEPVEKRQASLKEAVAKYGKDSTIHKLVGVSVLSKTKQPEYSKTYSLDADFVRTL
jgi:hypothetical protein